jgi:hypothetical protein
MLHVHAGQRFSLYILRDKYRGNGPMRSEISIYKELIFDI